MEGRLRLAERQGILTGRKLSPVQQYGLELLILVEEERRFQEQEQRRDDAIRMALLSAQPGLARGLLPEYFSPEEPEDAEDDFTDVSLNRPDTTYDLSGVTWQSPADMDSSQFDMLESLLADNGVTVSGTPAPEEGVEIPDPGMPFVPDNTEWT